MALIRLKAGGARIEVWEVDHGPPHCHVIGLEKAGNVVVELITLRVIRPQGLGLPPVVARCIRRNQAELLEAWDRVVSYPERE